ncbi:hypothetical protein V5F59_14580 [Xanthobacter autotrophicus DSM 431]|uniref:hypothetical protein n=1 Tax=Xanthobacter nonsaccharivorans TaxID=3119912 RepID=UPI00372AB7D2
MDSPAVAIEFYQQIVEPTVTEFFADPSDKRLACLACLCLSALAEHYVHATAEASETKSSVKELRLSSRRENWAVGQVNDIANATKHVIRSGPGIRYEDLGTQEVEVGNLRCGWPINGVEVMVETSPDGTLWLVTELVESANEWWRRKLGVAEASV